MSWFMSMKADNPVFLVLGALSTLLILAALYDGLWRLFTHAVVKLVVFAYGFALLGLTIAAVTFWVGLFVVEPPERAVTFLRAATLSGLLIAMACFVGSDNFVMRRLKRWGRFLTFPESEGV